MSLTGYTPIKGNAGELRFRLDYLDIVQSPVIVTLSNFNFDESIEDSGLNSVDEDVNGELHKEYYGCRQVISFSLINADDSIVGENNRKAIQSVINMIHEINTNPDNRKLSIMYRTSSSLSTITNAIFTGKLNLKEIDKSSNSAQEFPEFEFKDKELIERPNFGSPDDEFTALCDELSIEDSNICIIDELSYGDDNIIISGEQLEYPRFSLLPSININNLMTMFKTKYNILEQIQSFTVVGKNLESDITISCSNGFTLCSTENGVYDDSIIVDKEYDGEIFVKFDCNEALDIQSNISIISGEISINITVFGYCADGSESFPFRIENAEDLYLLSDEQTFSYNYIQMNDINLTGVDWIPIGNEEHPFNGNYDGNGFIISNLIYLKNDIDNIGLFGYLQNANIKNMTLINFGIKTNVSVGGLAGFSEDSDITNCLIHGSITGDYVGGIACNVSGGNISECCTFIEIIATNKGAGLFAVTDSNVNINNCYSASNITANVVGGLIAYIMDINSLSYCFYFGKLIGELIGGLVAQKDTETIGEECYWDEDVSGTKDSVCGINCSTEIMKNSNLWSNFDADIWLMEENKYPKLYMGDNNG